MAWFKNRMVAAGEISTRKLTVAPVVPDFTEAVETGNAISVVVQLKDPDGNAVARAVDLLCEVRKSDGLLATVAEFRLSETGDGTAVSTTAKPSMIITTDAEGQCTIAVLDQTGAYTGDAYLVVTPLNTLGTPGVVTLTFA
jgi:hypothetical protein